MQLLKINLNSQHPIIAEMRIKKFSSFSWITFIELKLKYLLLFQISQGADYEASPANRVCIHSCLT